jgi:two-component system CheB/CheR fusion protein
VVPEEELVDAEDDSFTIRDLQKPRQASINRDVYMKCFVHELRTPISTITMGLQLLKQRANDSENKQTIKDLQQSAGFIENILTKFVTVQDDNIELNEYVPFSFLKLVTNVEVLILYNFKESNVTFTYYIDPEVVLWNYGDVHNIKHVLINLLKNAIKYRDVTRENAIVIEIAALSKTEDQQVVRISVQDTNDPLLPHIKEHLFETFNSTSGSGLGLYICKTIVELHGGTIDHQFLEPRGNQFVIVLPLTMCHDASLLVHSPISKKTSRKASENTSRAPTYRVLLVDDSVLNRKMMYKLLNSTSLFGYIYSAEDGADALTKMNKYQDKIDLVLLDKNMPVMNGWDVVVALRNLPYNKLVVGLTGEDGPDEIQGFVVRGADYVIVKPLDKDKLELLRGFLVKHGTDRLPNKTVQVVNGQLEWV